MRIQEQLSKKVVLEDVFDKEIEFVCGVDVSYKKNIAQCSAVVIKKNDLEVVEIVTNKSDIQYPYIPGLFLLRESEPILNTLKLLKNTFQILLIDGHGILHPRRCGLASYIGIQTCNSTIGVAKSLLCGTLQADNFVTDNKDILGYAIKKERINKKKMIYVSIGHKISLPTSINIVKSLTKKEELIPEPLRIADISSKEKVSK
jgi:deoxyribonuclease V